MNARKVIIGCLSGIVLFGIGPAGIVASAGSVCISNPGTGPDICVEWFEQFDPVQGEDFTVTFTDEANPDLRLKSGSLTWAVWSKSGANPGDFGAITATDPEDFIIRVWNIDTDSAGARNVGSIELVPTGSNFSAIAKLSSGPLSEITGDFTGPLTLKGTGNFEGFCQFKVGGDVKGTWNVPGEAILDIGAVTSTANLTLRRIFRAVVSIAGNVDGPIQVTEGIAGEFFDFGRFIVGGDANANLTFGQVTTSAEIRVDGDCSATILVNNPPAVRFASTLEIGKQLTATGIINMNGRAVDGTIRIKDAGAGDVVGVGELGSVLKTATIVLGDSAADSFTGSFTATGSGAAWVNMNIGTLGAGGDVTLFGLESTGTIDVLGEVGGALTVGFFDMDGAISVTGDVTGDVVVTENSIGGTIGVSGNVAGDVHVQRDAGIIDIVGGLTGVGRVLVDGQAKGGITLGKRICPSALVRVVAGLTSTGFIEVNPASPSPGCGSIPLEHGDIEIGNGGDVIFDPSAYILISDGQNPPGGNWTGDIKVIGDFTEDPGADV